MKKGLLDLHAIVEIPRGNRPDGFARLPEIESFAKSETEHKLLTMYRAFRLVGTPYVLAPGTPKPQVQILQEAFRKALRDPDFHREFKKLSGFDVALVAEEQDKGDPRTAARSRRSRAFQRTLRRRSVAAAVKQNNKDLLSGARADD